MPVFFEVSKVELCQDIIIILFVIGFLLRKPASNVIILTINREEKAMFTKAKGMDSSTVKEAKQSYKSNGGIISGGRMKRILTLLVCFIVMTFVSCGKKTATEPGTIIVNGHAIKYSDTKSDIEDKLGEGTSAKVAVWEGYDYDNLVDILFNEEENSRCIKVISDKVKTFNDMAVGDSADKIEKKFKYETEYSRTYVVAFDGKKEVDSKEGDAADNRMWLSYYLDDNNYIEYILIYDQIFAQKSK